MTEEHRIQNEIRLAVAPYCTLFRTNSGDFWQGNLVYSNDMKQRVLVNLRRVEGLPNGFSDLAGIRISDGRAVYIEVKTDKGKVKKEQQKFIDTMKSIGAIAGVCRSVDDALELLEVVKNE